MDTTKTSKFKLFMLIIFSMIIPCSGYVVTGKPTRGLLMLMWIFVFGYITFHLTDNNMSFLVRLSGGFVVWCISITEIYKIGKNKN
jgi:hypothetical protein